jgi:MuDR family transposase
MNKDLSDEISWGSSQIPKIWYFDRNVNKEVVVGSESQVPTMFKMYEKERKISLLVVVCDADGSSKCNGANISSKPTANVAIDSQGGSIEGCNIIEHIDNFVGFNEEHMYGSDGETDLVHDSHINTIHEEQIGLECIIEEHVSHEETINDVADAEYTIAYDPNNPKIELNALFPDVDAFRKALRHYAIKNEFEFSTVKSDKKRFIGKCKHVDCPWKIRASRLQDNKTFMVHYIT